MGIWSKKNDPWVMGYGGLDDFRNPRNPDPPLHSSAAYKRPWWYADRTHMVGGGGGKGGAACRAAARCRGAAPPPRSSIRLLAGLLREGGGVRRPIGRPARRGGIAGGTRVTTFGAAIRGSAAPLFRDCGFQRSGIPPLPKVCDPPSSKGLRSPLFQRSGIPPLPK